ncbi:cobW-domain-containing protein [Acephala macrosclerotiorum]|nr:cobW-domain-containing protein [Acephala macrosclerotiorum]
MTPISTTDLKHVYIRRQHGSLRTPDPSITSNPPLRLPMKRENNSPRTNSQPTYHGLRIVVIINDVSSLNIDATLIQQHTISQLKENLIQLPNGCICCTLRGDLLEESVRLARTDAVQGVVIESTGISEPMQVAETFTSEFSRMMIVQEELAGDGTEMGGLHKLARSDTTASVVDAFNPFHSFDTTEFLSDRHVKENIIPEDERTITDLMVNQLDSATKARVLGLVKKLDLIARVIEAKHSKIDVKEIINTNMFSFEKAATGAAGWSRRLHELMQVKIGGKSRMVPTPETEEYGISSFMYRARRSFHPNKLWDLIYGRSLLLNHSTRQHGEWSQAGGMLTLSGGGPWFCTVPREGWHKDTDIVKAINADFSGPWGDRHQELVFISERVNQSAVFEVLDNCLLTNSEMRRWERVIRNEKYSDEEKEDGDHVNVE